jgi:hypothetical protein
VKDGIGKRKRCFDISSPFYLNVPKYKCQSHGKFNLLKCTSQNSFTFPSLVKFKKTIVTRSFLQYVFNLAPGHYFNFSKLLTTVQATWTSNFEMRVQNVNFELIYSATEAHF